MNEQDKQQLRELSAQLVGFQTRLEELNVQRNVLIENKATTSKAMIQIIEKPEFNNVQQLSVGDKLIKVIRQHNKPWALGKFRLRVLIYDYANTHNIPVDVASGLIQHIYTNVEQDLRSNEMKIELR
jgi:hypothetical protein